MPQTQIEKDAVGGSLPSSTKRSVGMTHEWPRLGACRFYLSVFLFLSKLNLGIKRKDDIYHKEQTRIEL